MLPYRRNRLLALGACGLAAAALGGCGGGSTTAVHRSHRLYPGGGGDEDAHHLDEHHVYGLDQHHDDVGLERVIRLVWILGLEWELRLGLDR